MQQDDKDLAQFEDFLDFHHWDIVYTDWDGSQRTARFVAEDIDHAGDIFAMYYPRVPIIDILDAGAAF
jgi:hypothetical protein